MNLEEAMKRIEELEKRVPSEKLLLLEFFKLIKLRLECGFENNSTIEIIRDLLKLHKIEK